MLIHNFYSFRIFYFSILADFRIFYPSCLIELTLRENLAIESWKNIHYLTYSRKIGSGSCGNINGHDLQDKNKIQIME